jgi:feruloyl esterase
MKFQKSTIGFLSGLLVQTIVLMASSAGAAGVCERETFTKLNLPDTEITLVESLSAGTYPKPVGELPLDVCRVAATLRPTADSEIKIEVWMPRSKWNGKFFGVGNGGWSGEVNYGTGMIDPVKRGYATASTDTGHTSEVGDASWAFHHPEKVVDFAYRAVHEMTLKGKAIVEAYYGSAPRFSYWSGCSTGGKQALHEVQQYPEDYNGLISSCPSNFWTRLEVAQVWRSRAVLDDPASFVPATKLPLIDKAMLSACDALDGVADGLLQDPRRCKFDPATLLCQGADTESCLTAAQGEAVKKIYAGPRNARTGELIFPGFLPGTELGWRPFIAGPGLGSRIAESFYKYIAFEDPKWDFRTFDFDKHVAFADRLAPVMNATSPDLSKFRSLGGKLILIHGWSDPNIPAQNSINYYEGVVNGIEGQVTMEMKSPAGATGGRADEFFRLFLVPGMYHCSGGPGPNTFDALAALERWVENGIAPDKINATKYVGDDPKKGIMMTRPLCPYPQEAVYTGQGSTNEANSFVCGTRPVVGSPEVK